MKLDGKKTYLAAFALLLYAVGGLVAGKLDFNMAFAEVMASLALMGLRHKLGRMVEKD